DLIREAGREAVDALITDARPLADLLWMRETSGRLFDTPERRAALEKTLRELANRIRDENLRRHYGQEFRDRMQAFFGMPARGGNSRAERARPPGKAAPGRFAVS